MSINKIDKTTSPYIDVVDENSDEPLMVLNKNIVDKINEMIDWINAQ
jgi:hypothetical protein|tara:strand:+ start:229 stop:369 length:141 start_codon:yes stop_codon:yes gene_type:complete